MVFNTPLFNITINNKEDISLAMNNKKDISLIINNIDEIPLTINNIYNTSILFDRRIDLNENIN